jgi:hypothetical protein
MPEEEPFKPERVAAGDRGQQARGSSQLVRHLPRHDDDDGQHALGAAPDAARRPLTHVSHGPLGVGGRATRAFQRKRTENAR